ncbi:hypothetical protein [Bdellovibrio sp. HCB337]|uniref:hypothetical protein n=1 Tax=Bdellovibrio sp. HCB337 TaxID=3394358 RepID=UPI0039A6F8FB
MKSLSKKAAAIVFALSSVAIAAGLITKEEVNKKIGAIAAPFNNENTTLKLEFTDLNVDSVRALDFGVSALVSKKGTSNELVMKLENAAYHYGDGKTPTVTGDLSVQLDLVKALGQEVLNGAAKDFETLLQEISQEYTQKYGNAATVNGKVEDVQTDAAGNIESAKLRIEAVVDFSKLPADLSANDVEFQSLQVALTASKTGFKGSLKVVVNPLNKSFQTDQPGLKELIEKILSEDAETYQGISDAIQVLNSVADSIVNQDPPADPQPQP